MCTYVCVFTVPALHKNPDVQIINNIGGTEFALIEHNKPHNGIWKVQELNQNNFNESGEIKYSIENWLFQIHPGSKVAGWVKRPELKTDTQKKAFKLTQFDSNSGKFSFEQKSQSFANLRFSITIIVLKKQTEHLEILYTSSLLSFIPKSSGTGIKAIKEICSKWRSTTKEKVKNEQLKRCPCTLGSAKMDPSLVPDFTCTTIEPDCHENVNAYRCFLMNLNDRYVCM